MLRDTRPPTTFISWRLILGPAMLLPSLVLLAWSLPRWNRTNEDLTLPGGPPNDRQRLKRLLHDPPVDRPAPLGPDVVRVAPSPEDTAVESKSTLPESDRAEGLPFDRALLATINDNHFGIPAAERMAYEKFLFAARSATLTEWERRAHHDVSFALLMLESARWRGELITVEGELRRLNRVDSRGDNESLATFEAWLFTAESGRNPYRILVTSQPAGIPLGDSIQPPRRVRLTGLFFKRFSYATANSYHSAPMLIAPALTELSSGPATHLPIPQRSKLLTVVAVGALLLFFGLIGCGQLVARRSHRAARLAARELRETQTPDFDFLNDSTTKPTS